MNDFYCLFCINPVAARENVVKCNPALQGAPDTFSRQICHNFQRPTPRVAERPLQDKQVGIVSRILCGYKEVIHIIADTCS